MISILGVGKAYAKNEISKELLLSLDPANASLIEANYQKPVYSTLGVDYILSSNNNNLKYAFENCTETTTDLAYQASLEAIQRAGINKDQIGLVLGDCATPVETIPGESQRLANKLGIKVPAYDMLCGSCAALGFIDSISNWKQDRIPDYILCVSSNSPTQRLNYSKGQERFYFSDAAGAMLISSRLPGKLKVKEAKVFNGQSKACGLQIDLFGYMQVDLSTITENYSDFRRKRDEYIKNFDIAPMLLSAHIPPAWRGYRQETLDLHDLREEKNANSLGAGVFCALSECWDSIGIHDILALSVFSLETFSGGLIVLGNK